MQVCVVGTHRPSFGLRVSFRIAGYRHHNAFAPTANTKPNHNPGPNPGATLHPTGTLGALVPVVEPVFALHEPLPAMTSWRSAAHDPTGVSSL